MGRPREFKHDEVLEKAMRVFWAKGFEATSLCDLTGAMGLSKSSLYETFGSKQDLFAAAIVHYRTAMAAAGFDMLSDDRPAKEVITRLFSSVVEMRLSKDYPRGCFLTNCASDSCMADPKLAAQVGAGMESVEEGFYRVIRRGQDEGDIPADRNARALARFLHSSLDGISVRGKAGATREELEDIAKLTLSVLD